MALSFKLKEKSRHWFSARMPVSDKVELTQKTSYIWPIGSGYLAMLVAILMMIGATNYQNNLAFLLTFLLIAIGLVCIVFTYKNLQGLRFTRLPCKEVFAGQTAHVRIQLVSLTGKSHYSVAIGQSREELLLCNVGREKATEVILDIAAGSRGYWPLPRFMVTSVFPFGWLRTWAYFRFQTPLLVYPEPIEPPQHEHSQRNGKESEEGYSVIGHEDLYGLKNYQQGEPLTRVDWKAYAREKGMYVREFVAYQNQQLCFSWNDFPNHHQEERLSYLTHMVVEASSLNLRFSMSLPGVEIEQGEGELHRKNCLRALALFNRDEPVLESGVTR